MLGVLAAFCSLTACANYDERLAVAHKQFYSQNVAGAVTTLEGLIAEAEGDNDEQLLRLELGIALQAAERYEESSAAFERVDDSLEVLDYTSAGYEEVAEFAFAPEAAKWRASPPERVMLNTQNMINYLARGEVGGAEIEARRMRNLVTMEDVSEDERFANTFAWALAGFSLELSGDFGEATGAQREAGDTSLNEHEPAAGQQFVEGEEPAMVVVIAQLGQAPIRRETQYVFPAGSTIHRLNVPHLVQRAALYDAVSVELDGVDQGKVPMLFDYGEHVAQRYDQELPTLLAAALFQAVGRALVAEGVAKAARESVKASSDSKNDQEYAALAGFFAGLITNWGLSELAGSDTRCWSLLPNSLGALRLNVPRGEHSLALQLTGRSQRLIRRTVDVQPGELVVINLVGEIYGTYAPTLGPGELPLAGNSAAVADTLEIVQQASWWAQVID
ncbi:MAG: hypothetical protein DHS20C15_32630 [Planctomycetota bacterium]|nr:MAG: hypothetical protein DHS20C15_32630 [Planctomycetota bacterium]